MIHDILLSCFDISSNQLPIEEFIVSEAVEKFLHPCEKKILQDIIDIIKLLRDAAKFGKIYGSNNFEMNPQLIDSDEPLQNGLYIKAFANGISNALEGYYKSIIELENEYLTNPTHSLLFIYQQLQIYEPLGLYIRKLMRGIRTQKLHGCAIVQYLHQNVLHGDRQINTAIRRIQEAVNIVFLNQLSHWVLYGKLFDSYGEFFIQCPEAQSKSTSESERCTSASSSKSTIAAIPDVASSFEEIWRHEICFDYLPHFLSTSWAEKVLFIGQTVLIFKIGTNINKNSQSWSRAENNSLDDNDSVWKENEDIFFGKLQALQTDGDLRASHFDRVIDEIKQYISTRLSEVAVKEADLVQQLKLIKEYFLLGRGELFLEFIRQTYAISHKKDDQNKIHDIAKCFELAAHAMGVPEHLEQFSLHIPKQVVEADDSIDYIQHVQLQYKVNWPLQLLFPPKVVERYNVLFRFLLQIKKMQYELHMHWCEDTRAAKLNKRQNIMVMHLRNQLMFFVDNLQYYIQVDALESQFSILLNTILKKADFEQIQRAHSVFQANVLSLCFLLADEDASKTSILQSTILASNNSVYVVLHDVLSLCEDFCKAVDEKEILSDKFDDKIEKLGERFKELIEQLIGLLLNLKAAASSISKSQLLVHLDFNRWFSSKMKRSDGRAVRF